MYSKNSLLIIAIMAVALPAMGTFFPSTNLVWADNIVCTTNPCEGTDNKDSIKEDDQDNQITGKGGDVQSQDSQAKTKFVEGPEMTELKEEMVMILFYQT
jgi:hypothetical protein